MVWLSIDTWLIAIVSLLYLLVLFSVAYWGQKKQNRHWVHNPYVYSLSLGVSCTSWAFYGVIAHASQTGQWSSPIYIGTIGCFLLAWPVLLKLLRVSKQQNISSIADFIASRYENTPKIAALVSIIALIGTIPYIALQLRAISHSFDLTTGSYQSGTTTTFAVTTVLIIFSILFGARDNQVNKQNPGLVAAIAFNSLIKLFIFIIAGLFATYGLFDGFAQLKELQPAVTETSTNQTAYFTLSQILLGGLTIFLTPQLYHMIVIENNDEQHLKTARWLYPLYLVLINVFVLPIAIAGQVTFPGGSVSADTYILTLPLYHHQAWLSGLVYIGGLAAAISMVIVAAIVLSTMLTTEIVTPALLKTKKQVSHSLLTYRRAIIAVVLLAGFVFERLISQQSYLASLGILAFVLLAQLAPAVLGALYWRKSTSIGAISGLIVGTLVWAYTLLIPMLAPNASLVMNGAFNIDWLTPTALFGIGGLDVISHGVFVSLLANTIVFVFLSLNLSTTVGEKLQAEHFLKVNKSSARYNLTVADVTVLLKRFIDQNTAEQALKRFSLYQGQQPAPAAYIEYAQNKLVSVLGSTSTRLVMEAATNPDDSNNIALGQVANIVDEANQLFEFNRELLQAGVENIEQGISVVDSDMRLVAWNQRYVELLQYPANFLSTGMHIADLLEFNAKRGFIDGGNIKALVDKRIQHMQAGHSHNYQRILPSGIVLEIRGQAMPGGGFVSTFSDITKHVEAERALQQANETLEKRVAERTQELESAKADAEAANSSKTRFLAAASHDLMQPFNAMSLFTEMLQQQLSGTKNEQLANQIHTSLSSVEAILSDLVEISKLDGSGQDIVMEHFALDDLLQPLANEFAALAESQNIKFSYIKTSVWVHTDKRLLRRLVQNLLANAIRYTPMNSQSESKILLGVRRSSATLKLTVTDNGPGIPADKQQAIFTEFERLAVNKDKPGLGLGLAICDRIAKLLNIHLRLTSVEQQGSEFSVTLDRHRAIPNKPVQPIPKTTQDDLDGLNVLIVDNEPLLLEALQKQLQSWNCAVTAINGMEEFEQLNPTQLQAFELIVADYHLDNGDNGVDLAQRLLSKRKSVVPVIICSADPSETLRQACSQAEFQFMKKPIKGLALKKQIKRLT